MNTQDIKDSKNLNAPSKGNVPAIRFVEYTEDYTQTTLGKIGNTYNGLTGKSAEDFGQGSPYITYKSIFDNSRVDISRVEYVQISDIEQRNKKQNRVTRGDIFFTTSSETPEEVGMTSVLLDNIEDCYLNSFCFGYRVYSQEQYLPEYLRFYLRSSIIRKKLFVLAQGSTRFNLSKNEVMRISINMPKAPEQRKIARFISLLEDRISIQSRIIEDLKKLKSAIVEMILCKQGGVLLKLGDVGSFIRGLTYSSEDISEDINATTVIRANNLNYGNNVSKEDVVYVNKKPTEIQILRKGDIVICMANGSSSLVGKNSYYSFDDRHSTIGAFCGIYRSSQPLVKWLMQSQRYRRLVYQSLQGGNGAIANLNGDDILNMTFRVIEDKKSVSILSALVLIENSIAVNEKLQELCFMQKEYLLQHLFI